MKASLLQVQSKLSEVAALRDDGLDTVISLALGRMESDRETRQAIVAKFKGYEREFWALIKVERELIANGRASAENSEAILSRSDASRPLSAVSTSETASDAASGPRDARETSPLPPSGDCF